MSGTDNSDKPISVLLHNVADVILNGPRNVSYELRRGEELEAEAEQLRARGEQLAARVEARENKDSGAKE